MCWHNFVFMLLFILFCVLVSSFFAEIYFRFCAEVILFSCCNSVCFVFWLFCFCVEVILFCVGVILFLCSDHFVLMLFCFMSKSFCFRLQSFCLMFWSFCFVLQFPVAQAWHYCNVLLCVLIFFFFFMIRQIQNKYSFSKLLCLVKQ